MLHARGRRAHDVQRHLGGADKGILDGRLLGLKLLGGVLGHAVGLRQRAERLGVGAHQPEQAPAQVRQLLQAHIHFGFHLGIRLLAHGQVAHHGRQRAGQRAAICRGPAAARRGGRRSKLLDERSIHTLPFHNQPHKRPASSTPRPDVELASRPAKAKARRCPQSGFRSDRHGPLGCFAKREPSEQLGVVPPSPPRPRTDP